VAKPRKETDFPADAGDFSAGAASLPALSSGDALSVNSSEMRDASVI
jgi:hypothetical protein